MPESNADILKEANQKYQEWSDLWQPIRDEGRKDVLCVAGEPWLALDPDGADKRKALNRPMITADELNQYTNQLLNDALTHPRGIKVSPRGFGANDQTAALRADKIREIEYRSTASTAYATMFQNAVERSYGFLRVRSKWEPGKWKQDLWIEPVVNPDLITPDPWALHHDGSDMRGCFVHEDRDEADFKEGGEFSGARMVDFSADAFAKGSASLFHRGKGKVRVAEYWKVKYDKQTLYAIKPQRGETEAVSRWGSEIGPLELLKLKAMGQILRQREENRQSVCMYLTNGLEILKKTEWKGEHIPIVPCYGKVLYVDKGAGVERRLMSLIRLARSPFMLYCYYRTCQAEIAGMIPKVPVMVIKGQLSGLENDWLKAPHEPLAFIEYIAQLEAFGDQVLPPPQRLPYEPGAHLQALELCAEGARRAIQSAMGAYALPTTAQRHNEKSGVALQEIKENTQIGNFHYMDHYNDAIRMGGVILDENLAPIHDMPGPIMVRTIDDKADSRQLNPATDWVGAHDVTITTGPSIDSERDEANALGDTLIGSKEVLAIIGPQKAVKLLAQVVKMRNPGPSGQIMHDIIDPPGDMSNNPLALQQELGQTKEQLAMVHQAAMAMKQALDAKMIEATAKHKTEAMKEAAETDRAKDANETKLAVAELSAKIERLSLFYEERARLADQAHDTGLAAADAGHEEIMADQAHQQALEAGTIAHQQGMEAQQQAADLAPPADAGA